MKRKIVKIDEEKCTGCGICIDACHEGALQLVDGKAKLVSESYCDGLGACLPECPANAITLEERDAAEYDEEAVKKHMESKNNHTHQKLACGCPGTLAVSIRKSSDKSSRPEANTIPTKSQLRQWPCQIRLVPPNASYFENAHLLVAADCTAYAYANIHNDFMVNRITIIGCPKLDDTNYAEKFTEILEAHEIKSITVLRMEVPCCGGIVNAVNQALLNSSRMIPLQVVTIGVDGNIMEK
ncbi:4Fe-4S binding protein [Fonticella tunisiensis]|uniref:4Fe-4S binding protein n=1 Tax=Fonticella tunisiensis TaxID=1096341 RepID=A0A4R7KQ91_9CLOT|nr:4Fe-4S binding protein [Fonticella tunisiensis]TDT61309.1 4Fe-4S binding protein [Fonticella tunisiensis]